MEPYWDCDCKDWSLYGLFQICAIILLVIITIGFPLFCGYITYKNVPRGSIDHPGKVYDDFGNLVDYTNEMYKDDLMNNASQKKCPYRFLYLGYERRWAFFKTYVFIYYYYHYYYFFSFFFFLFFFIYIYYCIDDGNEISTCDASYLILL